MCQQLTPYFGTRIVTHTHTQRCTQKLCYAWHFVYVFCIFYSLRESTEAIVSLDKLQVNHELCTIFNMQTWIDYVDSLTNIIDAFDSWLHIDFGQLFGRPTFCMMICCCTRNDYYQLPHKHHANLLTTTTIIQCGEMGRAFNFATVHEAKFVVVVLVTCSMFDKNFGLESVWKKIEHINKCGLVLCLCQLLCSHFVHYVDPFMTHLEA